ncbi:hypothetical protein MRX96_013315 [Rhipicephalus microplus]
MSRRWIPARSPVIIFSRMNHHERSDSGSEDCSAAASPWYPVKSTSWNKVEKAFRCFDHSRHRHIAMRQRDAADASSRARMYECPSWNVRGSCHDGASKDASTSTALVNSDQVSTGTNVGCSHYRDSLQRGHRCAASAVYHTQGCSSGGRHL